MIATSNLESKASHYQVARLAIELVPIALSLKGSAVISSFWSVCFYLSGILLTFATHLIICGGIIDEVVALLPKLFKNSKAFVALASSIIGLAASLAVIFRVSLFNQLFIWINNFRT